MPTIHREAGYRFFFYSQDHAPAHVHIEKDGTAAKFRLNPPGLVRNDGFNARELARIADLVHKHAAKFEDAWYGHFGNNT